jgi:hypothetical protein
MAKFKQSGITLDPNAVAAAQAATGSGSTPSATKAWLNAPINNTNLGLKDATGKLLPSTITGTQLAAALNNTKYNGGTIEALKQTVAQLPGSGLTKLSATGQISPSEITAINSIVEQGYLNSPTGTVLDLSTVADGIKNGTLTNTSPWTTPSTINDKRFDLPNVEASKALTNQIFNELLGKNATESQIQKYANAYLTYAAQNPVDTTTGTTAYRIATIPTASNGTSNRLMKGETNQTSIANGLNEKDFITNQVKNTGEFNAFQAAGTAFDLMKNLAQQNTGTL